MNLTVVLHEQLRPFSAQSDSAGTWLHLKRKPLSRPMLTYVDSLFLTVEQRQVD